MGEKGELVIEDGVEEVDWEVEVMVREKVGEMGKKIDWGR